MIEWGDEITKHADEQTTWPKRKISRAWRCLFSSCMVHSIAVISKF